MKKWMVAAKKADFNEIAKQFGISPITARLIRNRDIIGDENIGLYLNGGIKDLHDPLLMKDMDKACGILTEKIRSGRKIRIIGDYDADGIMSTFILVKGLKRLGVDVSWQIPDRMADGYGMNEAMIRKAAADGCDTVITCDNGITAFDAVNLAETLGMTVIVTDHHNITYEEQEDGSRRYILPEAAAVIDPKREDCAYPCRHLCGASVAWKLITALYDRFGAGFSEALEFIQYAAAATVTDVCELKGENRIIVREGLKMLQNTGNTGLSALIDITGVDRSRLDVYHIGFILGPCINASGRLKDADLSLKLLLAEEKDEAEKIARQLVELNESRKYMTVTGLEQAVKTIGDESLSDDRILVVYLPGCHESLAGIIAGRLREKYSRPAFVLTDTAEGLKGSGRSVEAYSMYDGLVKAKDLLIRFGGHPMAAGVTLPKENLSAFRKKINEDCPLTLDEMADKLSIDMLLPLSYVSEELIREIDLLKPFGTGNERPAFALKDADIITPSVVGARKNAVRMQIKDDRGTEMPGVYFGDAPEFCRQAVRKGKLSLVFYPDINSFRGVNSLQLKVTDYQ